MILKLLDSEVEELLRTLDKAQDIIKLATKRRATKLYDGMKEKEYGNN